MSVFLLKRLVTFVLTLVVASMVVFAVLELLPGNAAQIILGDTATPESLAALEKKLGLDQPQLQRYGNWIGGLLQGRSAIIIAHRLGTVQRADTIMILEGGRVAELGPRASLAADPDSRFAALLRTGLEEVLA